MECRVQIYVIDVKWLEISINSSSLILSGAPITDTDQP